MDSGSYQRGPISEKLEALSSQGQDMGEQLRLLRARNGELEGRAKELSSRKLSLQQKLLSVDAELGRKAAESNLQAENTNDTRSRLQKALRRKQDLVFAIAWMKAGLACASLHHITSLRRNVNALMSTMISGEGCLAESSGETHAARQRSTVVTKELEKGATRTHHTFPSPVHEADNTEAAPPSPYKFGRPQSTHTARETFDPGPQRRFMAYAKGQ
ncbi:hypothetical protein BESB_027700 [Besnoitia besnoiti]|uniref:Uncharacterized protein n=1 Tax=Besnoitia besnoiti TaxID=94643 RepID=A0A2A9M031_BESBE|nr:uncharacterized protein BESB_027700 [Besnoitia besnoiti]PFH31335.1 hypothetical protein BESB_027700 [Besnoitia besnoiti]